MTKRSWAPLPLFAAFLLVACAGAEQQPEKKWNVKVSTQGEARIWVSKPDGSKQCGEAPAELTPEVAAKEVKSGGIMVFQFRNGHDGMMHPTMCGAPTGTTVELEITRSDLPKVQALGYRVPRVSKR